MVLYRDAGTTFPRFSAAPRASISEGWRALRFGHDYSVGITPEGFVYCQFSCPHFVPFYPHQCELFVSSFEISGHHQYTGLLPFLGRDRLGIAASHSRLTVPTRSSLDRSAVLPSISNC